MRNLPEKVAAALEKLRSESPPPPYIILRTIHGGYYVYKDLISKDNAKGKKKLSSEYIGRITDDGVFIKRAVTKDDELENARAIIESHGGTVTLSEKRGGMEPAKMLPPNKIDNEILTILSMNARATLPFIAKRVGLSVSAVDNRIRHLEKKYGIEYITEIDVEKLGYLKFVILVRFVDEIPTSVELNEVIKAESRVQLALMLSGGDFNLLMYVVAKTNEEVNLLTRKLMQNTTMAKYSIQMYITPFHESYCFVPLRNEFVDTFVESEVKQDLLLGEELTVKKRVLLEREFAVLKEFNSNSVENFTDIDKKYEFDEGRAQYSYHKLLSNQLLRRPTLSMKKSGVKYIVAIFMRDSNLGQLYATRGPLLKSIIRDTKTVVNQYLLVGDIGAPYGALLFLPVFDDDVVDATIREILKTKGIVIKTEIVTNILVGKFCYRRFDNAHSLQSEILAEDYGMKTLPKVTYS